MAEQNNQKRIEDKKICLLIYRWNNQCPRTDSDLPPIAGHFRP